MLLDGDAALGIKLRFNQTLQKYQHFNSYQAQQKEFESWLEFYSGTRARFGAEGEDMMEDTNQGLARRSSLLPIDLDPIFIIKNRIGHLKLTRINRLQKFFKSKRIISNRPFLIRNLLKPNSKTLL
jgi:hypothetical protein